MSIRPDISLISPPRRACEPRLPLSLLTIASWAERKGIKADIIDVKINPYRGMSEELKDSVVRQILARVKAARPSIVGITCLTAEVNDVLNLSYLIKEIDRGIKVMVGGIHATLMPSDFLFTTSPVDIVVIGEGEETVTELVIAFSNKRDLSDVKGIAFWEGDKVYRTAPRIPLETLDEIHPLSYEKVDMKYYTTPTIYLIRNTLISGIHIFSGRGCPYKCTFCANKNLSSINQAKKPVRFRSIKNILDEIEYVTRNFLIDGFYVFDDTFTLSHKRVFEFCDELLKRKLNLIWGAQTRVDLVSWDMLKALKEARCVQLDFGVESGSQKILDGMEKGITIQQARDAFRMCHKTGIRAFACFMFNTLGETEEDVQKTLDLAREIDAHGYNFNLTTPYPGSELYNLIEPKLTAKEFDVYIGALDMLRDKRFKFCTHDIDLQKLRKSSHRRFNSLRKRIFFITDPRYLWAFASSRRKMDYMRALTNIYPAVIRNYLELLKFRNIHK